MDTIFSPWRIDWVERNPAEDEIEGCPFCVLPERDTDRDSRILARNDQAFVILNNYPYNPGHAMVVPYEHTGEYRALDDDTLLGHSRLLQQTLEALDRALSPSGFNTGYNLGDGAAGGSINDHVHAHVVPRWRGDTNFMPVIADTKMIVEAVDDTYERVHEAFGTLPDATVPGPGQAVEL
ncbi:HIT domain-containing protein [Halodesulfurarchaeum sp. HSR-GB]|uniref:HIT family protein n=1 Tax=Halodesulfurarchaeum sp. HSR-GB TaxID=3074077 RepID=UPI0028547BD7|nr:HIT domain-containing protein [Halodesulfurarchaeum sp. HSR-GB]MDR5656357.1 HIT domain-containing protein [Halodesulfurarchaeum sp. HSR-GB]